MQALFQHSLACPADQAWQTFLSTEHVKKISYPLVIFRSREKAPSHWTPGISATFQLRLFGVIPWSSHTIRIVELDSDRRCLVTSEAGGLIRGWRHRFVVESVSPSTCRCHDEIQIDAGVLTPAIWLYAQLYYRFRYFRWRSLL